MGTAGPTALDLFCGAGGSSTGLAQAGVSVVLAANHWRLAVEVHQLNHPETAHDCADISAVDPRRYPATDILWGSPECFPAGILILTARGIIPIEDIRVGDKVLTHRRRWRPVTMVMSRIADTVVVTGAGHAGLEVTAEHPFYARPAGRAWVNGILDVLPGVNAGDSYRAAHAAPRWVPASLPTAGIDSG